MYRIFRIPNLIFVAAIQLLIYFCVIVPTLEMCGLHSQMPLWVLICSVAATVLITAGGYVVNDYFDLKIDRLNRPEKVIVGSLISKTATMRLYQALTLVGVALGLSVAIVLRSLTVGLIFVVVPGMLWFYSASYKRQFLVGNLIVALSAALVPLIPVMIECRLLSNHFGELLRQTPITQNLYFWGCGFALFAGLFTLIREIIKDVQDQFGDREMECRTMPIVWGETKTKLFLTALIIATNALLAYLTASKIDLQNGTEMTLRYALVGIVAPSLCLIGILWNKSCTAMQNASTLTKFIMIVGTLYALFYNLILAKAHGIAFLGIFYLK